LVYAVLNKSPEPLQKHDSEISQGLQNTVLQAMAKQPDERYTSAVDLRDDLERLQQGLTPTAQPPRGRRWRRLAGLAAIAVVLAVVAVAVWNWQEWVPGNASAQIASLAVLPLENLSGDPAQDYFADGMTEALITDLGKLGRLQRVIARPSVERFKGSDLSLREIAGELNVKALVVGSATQEGERVRITAQLIRADNEEILWSDDYVRQRMDVLILQGEIARAIASEILGALTEPELSRITRTRTVDPEVHEAYLKGKFHLARFSPDGTTKALEYLQQAVAQNPDYAAAHASLGYAYFLAGQHFGLLPFKEAMAKSKTASLRAIEIDDSTAEAYSYLGYVEHFHEYNWTAAEDAYRKAVELNPSFSYGHSAYAFFLSTMGFHDAALEEARRAVELDPVSLAARVHLAEMLYSARRYDEMLEECQRIIDLDPTFTRTYGFTRRVYEQRQMYPEAIDAIEEYRMHGGLGTEHVADLRRAYERDGETGYWQYRLDSMLKRYGDTARTQFGIATIYAALGDADRAFEYLERSYENHEVDLVFINVHPMLDPLRSDQRFHALIRRMGFPEDT
jgi:TolB-like protein/Tfp pilus assembly protein PilF